MSEGHQPLHEALPELITNASNIEQFKAWLKCITTVTIVGNYVAIEEALRSKADELDGFDITDALTDLSKQEQEHEVKKAAATGS